MIWLSIDPDRYGIYISEHDQVLEMEAFIEFSSDESEYPDGFADRYIADLRELANRLETREQDKLRGEQ